MRERTINIFKLSISFALLMFAIICIGVRANAAGTPTINSKDVTIYGLESSYEEVISMPAGTPATFQLKVSNATSVSYYVFSGNSATVSSTGLISIKYTTWYWYGGFGTTAPPAEGQVPTRVETSFNTGDTVIRVNADGTTFDVKVHVKSYSDKYVDDIVQKYIDENINSSMTDLELLNAIAKFPASYDYDYHYSSCKSMVIYGGGDCWASTDAIITLCDKLGIEAWARNGNKDAGAGSGHMNAMVYYNGKYYELEAGYTGKAPRGYYVRERDYLFSYRWVYDADTDSYGICIYQYDGKKESVELVIPDYIDDMPVVSIGDTAFQYADFTKITLPSTLKNIESGAFFGCENLTDLVIPENVKEIGFRAFASCYNLNISVDKNNKYFTCVDNVIYTKDKTKLVSAFACDNITIPDTVTEIEGYAFYYNNELTSITLPKNVTKIGEGAFGDCKNLKWVDMAAAESVYIDDFAFYYCYKLNAVKMPQNITKMGIYAFRYTDLKTVLFYGDAPEFIIINDEDGKPYDSAFSGSFNAYYPKGNTSWTSDLLTGHGGTITWNSWTPCKKVDISVDSPVIGHNIVKNATVAATCTTAGSTGGSSCKACGEIISKPTVVAALGHNEVTDAAVAPTCTKSGKTAGSHCSRCGKVIKAQTTVAATGHTAVTDPAVAATCLTEGKTAGSHCLVCGTVITAQQTIAKKAHTVVTDKGYDSTCKVTGLTDGSHCSVCNTVITAQKVIAKKAHKITSSYVEKAPTYRTVGVKVEICSACGDEIRSDIPKLAPPQASASYRTHVQSYGWQSFVKDGAMSGTSGEAKRLEGIEIKLNTKADLGIQYTTHVQSYGWLGWNANGEMSGTSGEAKRLEAILIQLTGNDKDLYDVYYRVHAQSYGWLGWAKNGEPSGTAGYAKRLEGIQIVVVPKGEKPSNKYLGITSATTKAYVSSTSDIPKVAGADSIHVKYQAQVEKDGWKIPVYDGADGGTSGRALKLQGLKVEIANKLGITGGVQYRSHVQSTGWESTWKKDGDISGNYTAGKRLEAIQIKLYGALADKYDIYYRAHVQSFGWLGWAKNGESAGSAGYGYRVEAVQIKLVKKGAQAPGSTKDCYKSK